MSEERKTGPGRLELPPGAALVGIDPQREWDALVELPDDFLDRIKADVFGALSQGAPWQLPAATELGLLASLVKEVQRWRSLSHGSNAAGFPDLGLELPPTSVPVSTPPDKKIEG